MNSKSFHCRFCCISAGLMWNKMHWIQMFLFISDVHKGGQGGSRGPIVKKRTLKCPPGSQKNMPKCPLGWQNILNCPAPALQKVCARHCSSLNFTWIYKKEGHECNVATKGNMLANQAHICDRFPPSWEQKDYKVSDSQNKIYRMAEPSASVFIGLPWPLKLFLEMETHHNFHENIHTQKDKQINTRHWGGIFTSCGAIFRPMARKIPHFETAFMKFGELMMHQLCNIISHRHINATFCRKSRVWWKKKNQMMPQRYQQDWHIPPTHTHTIRKHLEYPSQTEAAVTLKL